MKTEKDIGVVMLESAGLNQITDVVEKILLLHQLIAVAMNGVLKEINQDIDIGVV